MPAAARVTDQVQHTNTVTFIAAAAVGGAAIAAVLVLGGAVALPAAAIGAVVAGTATVGLGFSVGAGLAQLGTAFKAVRDLLEDGPLTGPIATGASDVKVGSLAAARAEIDTVACEGTPPFYMPSHVGKRIATGSGTVHINGWLAVRQGDIIECAAKIRFGMPSVNIGGPTVQVLDIDSEIPEWVNRVVFWVGLLSSLTKYGIRKTLFAFVENEAFGKAGMWLGGKLFGEGSEGQIATTALVQWLGPGIRMRATRAFARATSPALARRTCAGDPVDVASGTVVHAAVDLSLPGLIPLEWKRHYASGVMDGTTALGRGGFTHSFDQWVEQLPGLTIVRDDEGRDLYFPVLPPGSSSFHRPDRLTLTALTSGGFTLHSPETRLTRHFLPLAPGERARLREIRDPHGNTVTLHYDGKALHHIVDTVGRELRIESAAGLVTRAELWAQGELQQWIQYTFDDAGRLAAVTDALGNTERYAYDVESRLTGRTLANGVVFHYDYDDATGWCTRSWGDGGLHSIELHPDLARRITTVTGTVEPRVYHWNDDGLVTREEAPDGTLLATWEYDRDTLLVAKANGAGHTTRYEHDARGHKIREIDPAGNVTRREIRDDLLVSSTDPDGARSDYRHDATGNLIHSSHPPNAVRTFTHDARGRLQTVTLDGRLVAAFDYDAFDNVIAQTDAAGSKTLRRYDPLGRVIEEIDPAGGITRTTYDRLGHAVQHTCADGTEITTDHDVLGNPIRVKDGTGFAVDVTYAGTGALTSVTYSDGRAWQFQYNPAERVQAMTNPRGERHELTYDPFGRPTSEKTFDGRLTHYEYSPAGDLAVVVRPDGSRRRFEHDALGNVTLEDSGDTLVRFERDRRGRLLRGVVTHAGRTVTTTLQRDRLGRVAHETQDAVSVRHAHDALGRRTLREPAVGPATRFEHDARDRPTRVQHGSYALRIDRDPAARQSTLTNAAETLAVRTTTDAMARVLEQHATATTAAPRTTVRRRYHHDDSGRVAAIDDARWGRSTYVHDDSGRLLEHRRARFRESFSHTDDLLRRVPRDGADWHADPGNRLSRAGAGTYEHDLLGRRTRESRDDTPTESKHLSWDGRDCLRSIRLPSGALVRFDYDCFARRVSKQVVTPDGATRTTRYVWDGDVLASEHDSTTGARDFIHDPASFTLLLQSQGGTTYTVVGDHLGTPRELLDERGNVAWSATHAAFGEILDTARDPAAPRVAVTTPFRFPGMYEDTETGLFYTRFRYFDPRTARWLSPDPLGLAGGWDAYAFDGSPIHEIDPLGLGPCSRKAAELLRGKNVRAASVKEADAIIAEALPNGREVRGAGPGAPDFAAFKGKDPNGMYHKDYLVDPSTGRIYGHGPNNFHGDQQHINVKLPDGSKTVILIDPVKRP